MSRKYYYLAASLPDLFRGRTSTAGSLEEYLGFCREVLHPDDYAALMQLFLLNDIRNAVDYREPGDFFALPSYFGEQRLRSFLEEPSPDIPFIGRFLAGRESDNREFPNMTLLDEAITFFYREIDRVSDDFIRAYFLHELDVRNIATALELRANGFPLAHRLIPQGLAYERLTESDAEDWGLTEDFPFVKTLLPLYRDPDMSARESALDEVRWQWCDEAVENELFSFHAIVAYGIKLMSIERWSRLDEEAGNELFMDLLSTVQRSVRFAIEFASLSEEQREERRRQLEAERRQAEQDTEKEQNVREERQ